MRAKPCPGDRAFSFVAMDRNQFVQYVHVEIIAGRLAAARSHLGAQRNHSVRGHLSVSKAFLLLFVAVVGLGQASAQGSSTVPSGSSRSHRGAVPGGERSMKGCLIQDESGAYFLQTPRSAKVKLESAEDLASRVGRQVKVTGAFVEAQPGSSSAANHANSNLWEKSHSSRVFRVFRIDVLSQTCNARKK